MEFSKYFSTETFSKLIGNLVSNSRLKKYLIFSINDEMTSTKKGKVVTLKQQACDQACTSI